MAEPLTATSPLSGALFRTHTLTLSVSAAQSSTLASDLPDKPVLTVDFADQVLSTPGTPKLQFDFPELVMAVYAEEEGNGLPQCTVTVEDVGPAKKGEKKRFYAVKVVDLEAPETRVEIERYGYIVIRHTLKELEDVDRALANSNHFVSKRFIDLVCPLSALAAKGSDFQCFRAADEFCEQFPQVKDLVYLLIPGLFTEHYPLYMKENMRWLTQYMKVTAYIVPIDTDASVTKNVATIKQAIELRTSQGQRAVLIGHSKGGVDAAVCLARHFDALSPKIYGLITMQSPYGGTYVADWVNESWFLNSLSSTMLKIWKGERDAFLDLSFASRRASIQTEPLYGSTAPSDAHPSVPRIAVPTVAVASTAAFNAGSADNLNDKLGVASMGMSAAAILSNTGFKSDGLVAPHDGRMPGADVAMVPNMFHTQAALHAPGNMYHCGALMQALVQMLVEKRIREGCED